MGQLCRLATLSRVLYDKEMLDLRNEIELLKLKLFWTNHHIDKVQECFVYLNRTVCKCSCGNCVEHLHEHEDIFSEPYDIECRFVPFIKWIIQDLVGMKFKMVHPILYGDSDAPYNLEQEKLDYDNAHFVVGFWQFQRSYGPKLSEAKSVNDPELLKLKAFFDLALPHSKGIREDIMSTHNYFMTPLY